MNRTEETTKWYDEYYKKRGEHRNSIRSNPGVLMQCLATEASLVRAVYSIEHDTSSAKVLDVGCGGGFDLYQLLRLKYDPENIVGLDVLPERIAEARKMYPHMKLIVGDASQMEFADGTFDMVYQSGMFVQLTDDDLRSSIAEEMIRVCKVGGYILLSDLWMPKPGDSRYKALTKSRMRNLFGVGTKTRNLRICHGALVPPVGRFLSQYCPSIYFAIASMFPFLVGQVTYLLQKMPCQEAVISRSEAA